MRILIPVDGSQHATAAVKYVATHLAQAQPKVHIELLNVQAPIPTRAARLLGRASCHAYYAEEASKVLRPAAHALAKAGTAASSRFVVGHAIDVIADAASKTPGVKAAAVDLLVMGTHGHGALMRLLMGSVTTGVLARTTTPILLLRAPAPTTAKGNAVVIATDGSRHGLAAVRYTLKHRKFFGANTHFQLVHVAPDFLGAYMPDMAGVALPAFSPDEIKLMQNQSFEAAIEPAQKLFDKAKVPVQCIRLTGEPGQSLSEYANKKKISTVVMGSHGRGALQQAVMGSVATRVTARSRVPVLLIRKS